MTLPVLAEVEAEYRQRPEWPAAAAGQPSIFASDSTPVRLRDISLAGISATMTGREEASGAIPPELDNLIPGTAFDDYKGVTVMVRGAEMYALGLDSVLAALVDTQDGSEPPGYVLKPPYRRFLPLMAGADSEVVWLRVVSEVIYMRSVDYTVQPAQPPDDVEDVPPPDMTSARKPPPAAEAPPGDPAVMAFQRADEINRLLAESGNDRLPGGAIRVLSVTEKSASLRHTWSRGLAVGVRGLTLEVDKNTGAVRRIGAMGAPLPRGSAAAPAPGA